MGFLMPSENAIAFQTALYRYFRNALLTLKESGSHCASKILQNFLRRCIRFQQILRLLPSFFLNTFAAHHRRFPAFIILPRLGFAALNCQDGKASLNVWQILSKRSLLASSFGLIRQRQHELILLPYHNSSMPHFVPTSAPRLIYGQIVR